MKKKIIIFALMAAIVATLFAVSVSAAGNVDYNGPACAHNNYDYVDGVCEDIVVDGVVVGHSLRVQCNVCDVFGYVTTSQVYERTFFDDEYEYIVNTCQSCDEEIISDKIEHVYDLGVCDDCNYVCEHSKYVSGRCAYCNYGCSHAEYEDGVCIVCGMSCVHNETYVNYVYYSPLVHKVETYCTSCDQCIDSVNGAHSMKDGPCKLCGASCDHTTIVVTVEPIGAKQHRNSTYCTTCKTYTYSQSENHIFVDGICSLCNYRCLHANATTRYETAGADTHYTQLYCSDCDMYVSRRVEYHHSFNLDGCACICGAVNHNYVSSLVDKSVEGHEYELVCNGCGDKKTEYVDHNDADLYFGYSYLSNTHHTMLVICRDCNITVEEYSIEHIFKDGKCVDCHNGCRHNYDNSGRCTLCASRCGHDVVVESIVSLTNKHAKKESCYFCGYILEYKETPCEYVSAIDVESPVSYCRVCDNSCTHDYGVGCVCLNCGSTRRHVFDENMGPYYSDVICYSCGFECPHTDVTRYSRCDEDGATSLHHNIFEECNYCHSTVRVDSDSDWRWVYTRKSNTQHNKNKECLLCGDIIQTVVEDHVIEYGESRCSICEFAHTCVLDYATQNLTDGKTDRFYCSLCQLPYGNFKNLSTDVPHFSRLKGCDLWNIRGNYYTSGDKYSFRRFYIKNYNDNAPHSASINLIGGTSFPADVGSMSYCRYIVFRLRYKDIRTFEFDIYASNSYSGGNLLTTDCRQISNIPIGTLPENRWVNIVIDLNNISGFNKSAYNDNYPSYKYVRAVACFQYADAGGYVDIDYFAMAQTKAQLDILLSRTHDDYNSSYYVYNGSFTQVSETHSFTNSKCTRCGWNCPHTVIVPITRSDDMYCWHDDDCARCDYLVTDLGKASHVFTGNVINCINCDRECLHDYKNTYCKVCKWHCTHGFEGGHIRCIYCGYYVPDLSNSSTDGFYDLITSIYDGQVNVFFSMLSYDIFGVNIASMIIAIIALAIVLFVLKKVL